jgi:hypothetical protein
MANARGAEKKLDQGNPSDCFCSRLKNSRTRTRTRTRNEDAIGEGAFKSLGNPNPGLLTLNPLDRSSVRLAALAKEGG